MVEGDLEDGGCELRVRWVDTVECGPFVRIPVGRGWSWEIERASEEGCAMVWSGGEICELREEGQPFRYYSYVDSKEGRNWPGIGREAPGNTGGCSPSS